MSIVVNRSLFEGLFDQLGWPVSFNDLVGSAVASGLPDGAILAYLQKLAANPSGMDDSQIQGCPPDVAAEITAFLHQRGLVGI